MTPGLCGVCGKPGDLRPYGAGGSLICFPCMKAKPEREAEADRQINRLLDEQGRAGSVIAGTMVDFQRSGDLVQVEIRPHGNVETVKVIVTPAAFRETLPPTGRALFDKWWGKVETS